MYKSNSIKSQNFKEMVEGVWLYSNFIEDCKNDLSKIPDSLKNNGGTFKTNEFEKYKDIVIDNLFGKDILKILYMDEVVVRVKGHDVPVHVDVQNWENKLRSYEIEKNDNTEVKHLAVYGYIIYLNDNYEGGEIFYPEFNFSYKPKPGDLIVHDVNIPHGVKKILAGERVSIAGTIGKDFYFSPEVYALADEPNTEFDEKDPRYFFAANQGESSNPRLKKYMDSLKSE
jgi:hypothetical protein